MIADGCPPEDARDGLRTGEPAAADRIVREYTARLLELARSKVGRRYRRRFDAEDVVQSAFGIFFSLASSKDFDLDRDGELWRMLAALTMNRVRNRIRMNNSAKRAVSDEDSVRGVIPHPHYAGPGPEDLITLEDEVRSLRHSLLPEHRYIFDSLLQGQSAAVTAAQSGCSERTVQRVAADVRDKLESRLGIRHELNG